MVKHDQVEGHLQRGSLCILIRRLHLRTSQQCIWNTTPLQGETFPVADSAARATIHSPEVVPTDLLTCSGDRPGKGIKRNLHHQHHLEEVYDFDDPFPNISVCGRGSFLCGCGISNIYG